MGLLLLLGHLRLLRSRLILLIGRLILPLLLRLICLLYLRLLLLDLCLGRGRESRFLLFFASFFLFVRNWEFVRVRLPAHSLTRT